MVTYIAFCFKFHALLFSCFVLFFRNILRTTSSVSPSLALILLILWWTLNEKRGGEANCDRYRIEERYRQDRSLLHVRQLHFLDCVASRSSFSDFTPLLTVLFLISFSITFYSFVYSRCCPDTPAGFSSPPQRQHISERHLLLVAAPLNH